MTSKLDAALALAKRGFKVFPIKAGAKFPPLVTNWPQLATSNETTLAAAWSPASNHNIGIHCEGLLVLDVDVAKGGDESLAYLQTVYDLPETLTTITPSGGKHLFYRLPAGHPGVPNSVERIGKGIDVRSTGGYVVAPGSITEAGKYRFEADREIADAPDWLILKAGTVIPKTGTNEPVPDAPDAVLERARQWLAKAAPAIEGQGGDAHTFAVAARLRDFGVSETQTVQLMLEWNDRCQPPWSPQDLAAKVANAYAYAQNEPGVKAALPEDFPVHDSAPAGSGVQAKKVNVRRLSQFTESEHRGPGYLIKGLLQRRSYAELFGQPGAGKTFVALDAAYHVAAGRPWMGRKVHGGTVLYLAYEGIGGMTKRAQALRQKYGDKDVPLYIAGADFDLRQPTGRQQLGALLKQIDGECVMIIIDTLARALSMSGGDENSAQDVGAFNSAIAALIENTGACVMIIHHSGKNKSAGARGSSALLGAIDTELEVDDHQIVARKQRDVELTAPLGFKLVPMVVGLDEDGDELTSCTVDADEINAGPKAGRITGNAKRGFDVLCELRPTNDPITDVEWKEACRDFLGDRDVNKRFWDIKKNLMRKGYVEVDEQGMVTRRCE